jgi:heat-inducible transcriptional repressor
MRLDDRAKLLLNTLVESYIADGQPVGSRSLSKIAGLDLSPATIRNVMSDLEELGLIASPHTSAGRIPTSKGYRFFVDTMLTVRPQSLHASIPSLSDAQLSTAQPQRVIDDAARLLSNVSQFVGVVLAPQRASVFRHIEFLALSDRRVLVIMVSPDGDVQNRVVHTQSSYTPEQLTQAAHWLNTHFAGMTLDAVKERIHSEVELLRSEIAGLMQAAVQANDEVEQTEQKLVVSGEKNLLSVSDYSNDLGNLRKMFDLFEQKTLLMRLLELSNAADGVGIFIGGGSPMMQHPDIAVVAAPYEVNGMVLGTLAVIGPQRMPYHKMIQLVDVTAKLLGHALSQPK